MGFPILTFMQDTTSSAIANNLGVNSTGQVPVIGNFGLIDMDTPEDAYTSKSLRDGSEWVLVFSDEFEQEGRSFYPGDDPYWEAVDLHYWVRSMTSAPLKENQLTLKDRVRTTWSGMILRA